MGKLTIEDIGNAVFGVIQDYVEDNRDKTDVWEDWCSELSRNRWANKKMDALVAGCTHLVVYQVNDRGKSITDRNVEGWVQGYVDGEYACEVMADKGYFRDLKDREQDDVEDAVADHEQLVDDVEDYWEELQDEGRSRNKRSRGGRDRDDRDDDRGRGRGGRERSGQRGRSRSSSSRTGSVRRRRDDDDAPQPKEEVREERAPREPRAERQSKAEPRTKTIVKPGFDGPDYTKPRPYDEFWRGDQFFQLASISKMFPTEVNFDSKGVRIAPFVHVNTAYNPDKEIRYYAISPDKIITEEYIDMSREADYLMHQRLSGSGRRHKTDEARPERVQRVKAEFVAPVNIPDESATLQRLSRAAEAEGTLSVIGPFAVSSSQALEAKARYVMLRDSKQLQIVEGSVYTIMVARDAEEAAQLMAVANANNCAAAFEALNAIEITRDAELLSFVDRRLSAELTHELRCRFGVPVNVEGFSTNYENLLKALEKRFDAAMVRGFCQGSRHVPNTALRQLPEDVKKETAMDALGLTESEYAAASDRIIVVSDDVSYLMIDATLHDIQLSLNKMPEIIDPNRYPNFHQLCQVALKSDLPGNRSFIQTRDGHRIEVIESPTLKDTVMARLDS